MITNQTVSSRFSQRRPAPAFLRVLLGAALCLSALPAFAQQAALAANLAAVPAAGTLAMTSPTFTSDFNRMLAQTGMTPPAPGGRVQNVLKRALALLGTPYRWGGTSPEGGFDCSGLVGYVFRTTLGIELPRISRDMAQNGQLISDRAALAAGDLVFFGRKGRVDHVGIYVGEGNFVHAPRTGRDVTVSSLSGGYWGGKFMQARRVAGI